jgi:hypothetical protein
VLKTDAPREIEFPGPKTTEPRPATPPGPDPSELFKKRQDSLKLIEQETVDTVSAKLSDLIASALPQEMLPTPANKRDTVTKSIAESYPQVPLDNLLGEGVAAPKMDLFEPLQNNPLKDAFSNLFNSTLLQDLKETVIDRGIVLRQKIADWTFAIGSPIDWLHEQSVREYAVHTGDPALDQVERTFSAANPRNIIFGIYKYNSKVVAEGGKTLDAYFQSLGLMP